MTGPALDGLRVRFRTRLERDLATLRGLGPGEEMESLVHRLAGAAGLFGFDDVAAAAAALDRRFARGETPGADDLNRLMAAMEAGAGEGGARESGAVAPEGDNIKPPEVPEGGAAILLVEDDDLVRAQAGRQLRALGYRVIAVPGVPEALARVRAGEAFDLLFTDLQLPGPVDGVQLARQVREARPGVRVLLTSGRPSGATPGSGDAGPGAPLLTKPYRREALGAAVREVLGDGGRRTSPGEEADTPT